MEKSCKPVILQLAELLCLPGYTIYPGKRSKIVWDYQLETSNLEPDFLLIEIDLFVACHFHCHFPVSLPVLFIIPYSADAAQAEIGI